MSFPHTSDSLAAVTSSGAAAIVLAFTCFIRFYTTGVMVTHVLIDPAASTDAPAIYLRSLQMRAVPNFLVNLKILASFDVYK